MTHVLTLIGAPSIHCLTEEAAASATAVVEGAGGIRWLSPGEALDIPFTPHEATDCKAFAEEIRAALGPVRVDVAVQPADSRRKRLLVADMDSTIIRQECIDELADFAGIKPQIAAITERAMRGEIEFSGALRERVQLLAGLDEAVLQHVIEERVELMPGARALVATMRAHGAFCALVSGGFSFFASRIAARAGFDAHQANILDIASGTLTGRVVEPIFGRNAKFEALRRHRAALGLTPAETMAVGDGANDLAMLAEAGVGVAFHAKPAVAGEADVRIDHGDLTALLYLQGYARDAFVIDDEIPKGSSS